MRIIFFSQHFAPEVTASRARAQAFAEGLTARGHEVEVIAAVPNHPDGVVPPGYGGKFIDRRHLDGYAVTYVWVRTSSAKTALSRLAVYGTYAASAATAASLSPRPDVVLATSPPLPVASAAAIAARRHRVPWVMDVRDLWPEAAVTLGELTAPRVIAAAERLERGLYRGAAEIVTVTGAFRDQIATHVDRAKIEVIPNGTTQLWLDAGAEEPDREAAGLPADQFVWVYAGNLGIAQGLEHAIDAAAQLGSGFRLVLLGSGPQKRSLQERAAACEPGTVEFREPVQAAAAARQLRAADALLVSLDPAPEMAKFIPSKLFDYCALRRPVILAARGESPEWRARRGPARSSSLAIRGPWQRRSAACATTPSALPNSPMPARRLPSATAARRRSSASRRF